MECGAWRNDGNLSHRTQVNIIFFREGSMLRHPNTATYLSRVKSQESDSGTAADLIKRDREE